MNRKPRKYREMLKLPAMMLLGNLAYALTVKLFLLPSNLMSSGTTGLALIARELTGVPLPTFILAFNVAMLLLGLAALGWKFAATTVVSSLVYPVLLELLDRLLGSPVLTENPLLSVVFSGMGIGLALGVVIRAGGSTGGMDIPPLVLQRYLRIPVSGSLYAFDFLILLGQMFYHPVEDLLYGVLLIMLTSYTLNKTLLWGVTKTEIKIVSEKSEEIRQEILQAMDRGVTVLYGEGGYLRRAQQVLLSVVSNYELAKVERIVHRVDPSCFMIVSRVSEVRGRGFSQAKEYR